MDLQTQIFKRFRNTLPYSVSSDAIMVVLNRCIDRILELDDKQVDMLLRDEIIIDMIDYGALNQSFDEGQVIHIRSSKGNHIMWEFDPHTGEWVAS